MLKTSESAALYSGVAPSVDDVEAFCRHDVPPIKVRLLSSRVLCGRSFRFSSPCTLCAHFSSTAGLGSVRSIVMVLTGCVFTTMALGIWNGATY